MVFGLALHGSFLHALKKLLSVSLSFTVNDYLFKDTSEWKHEIFKNAEIVENCRYFVVETIKFKEEKQLNSIKKKINISMFLDC